MASAQRQWAFNKINTSIHSNSYNLRRDVASDMRVLYCISAVGMGLVVLSRRGSRRDFSQKLCAKTSLKVFQLIIRPSLYGIPEEWV